MFNYPIRLEYDKETAVYVASCRDLPLFNSVGDSVDEALLESVDGLITAISIEIDERRPISNASAVEDGEYVLSLPILVTMKAALHNAMIETGTRKADLARRLGQKGPQIDRLLDVEHSSKVETVELALHQLDRKLDIAVHVV
ncbi:hypothetical protein SK355_11570 (plasmid) [Candidatus Fukatsuia symbiotica]|uniref:HicB-like antitoxin of toxin-antitoxin system domain-containing protein n=1 Tax=Candidatus Fukatsuia symbiotica TaxID=1878942 RepID=A0A2U8IB69_9GAMM|nr:hypothetical protein [Candidatus Fukatsuia symbiotica]AWK15555.1 hypothetical protein CCS41_14115 [Candidatus Fukatsuia symbiotica]MEA9445819.1 hypothetical protein [Candidatus Fukatsuia symbiotica]